jgi:hypothetical protein
MRVSGVRTLHHTSRSKGLRQQPCGMGRSRKRGRSWVLPNLHLPATLATNDARSHVHRLRQSADSLRHRHRPFTPYFIAAPAILCWAGGQFGLKICFTRTRAVQTQKTTALTTLACCMHPIWEASLSRMTQCHAIYLVIFAVSTCKANGHAGCEALDTTST